MRKLLLAAVLMLLALPALGSDVCPPLDSGKIDTTGDPATVTVTAPDGFLIDGYCVKAGPTFVMVTVDPPQATVVVDHPVKDSVSHYSLSYTEVPSSSTTTTTSIFPTTTTPSSTTSSSTTTTQHGNSTSTTSSTITSTTTPAPTTTAPTTSSTSQPTSTSQPEIIPPETTITAPTETDPPPSTLTVGTTPERLPHTGIGTSAIAAGALGLLALGSMMWRAGRE